MAYKRTLVTGGHNAGKTTQALRLAASYPSKIYLATAEAFDEEMQAKIIKHRAERDESYSTVEEPIHLGRALKNIAQADLVIVDCLTVWVNNLLHYGENTEEAFDSFFQALGELRSDVVFVTNESNMGIISFDEVGRRYQALLAKLNNRTAALSDEVYLMVSGIAVRIK